VKATPRERELMERLARADRDELRMREEYTRYNTALEGLMRAVLLEVCSDYAHPTSINCGRLIAAVEIASRTVHSPTVHSRSTTP
jgi:hypothetical protein